MRPRTLIVGAVLGCLSWIVLVGLVAALASWIVP